VNEVENEGWKRKRRQVAADRGAGSWNRRQSLERYDGADTGEGKNTASAIDEMIVDLDERSDGSPRERDGSERRDRRVDVTAR
jgi:hypothetical protein